jgi:hypothetical protein
MRTCWLLLAGNLTMKLLERAKKVIAIELDPRMVSCTTAAAATCSSSHRHQHQHQQQSSSRRCSCSCRNSRATAAIPMGSIAPRSSSKYIDRWQQGSSAVKWLAAAVGLDL